MEPTEADSSDTTGHNNQLNPKCATDTIEGIDVGRLNELLVFVREKLTTDLLGNLTISGNKQAKDGRHTQLREVVELFQLLESVKTAMDAKNEEATSLSAKDARKAGKASGRQVNVVRSVVQEEIGSAMRDVTLEYQALKTGAQKSEERMKKAEKENVALQEKFHGLQDELKATNGKLAALEKTVATSIKASTTSTKTVQGEPQATQNASRRRTKGPSLFGRLATSDLSVEGAISTASPLFAAPSAAAPPSTRAELSPEDRAARTKHIQEVLGNQFLQLQTAKTMRNGTKLKISKHSGGLRDLRRSAIGGTFEVAVFLYDTLEEGDEILLRKMHSGEMTAAVEFARPLPDAEMRVLYEQLGLDFTNLAS